MIIKSRVRKPSTKMQNAHTRKTSQNRICKNLSNMIGCDPDSLSVPQFVQQNGTVLCHLLVLCMCTYLMLQCPPANEDTLALREACLLDPLERPPKHCK